MLLEEWWDAGRKFQQVGVPLDREVRIYLKQYFPERLIGRGGAI